MKHSALVALAVGALAAIFLTVIAALATYDAMSSSDMMDGMWDMMDGMMGGGDPETTGSARGHGEVTIEDFRFEPTVFTVTVGTVVKWTNEDSAPHTATARDGSFDTGRLDQGESGEVTFDAAGTFEYYCVFHPWMEGKVVVGSAGG